jgi:hypothetical protein
VTCEQVREQLSEHTLGTLDEIEDAAVRRHLRACAGCRAELASLGEGLSMFASAAHDQEPPAELQARVMTILDEEWKDTHIPVPEAGRRLRSLAVAAAIVVAVGSIAWGVRAVHRANVAVEGSRSYTNLLSTLGGKDFRVGVLMPAGSQVLEGSVVLYDSHVDQSWGLVLVRAPGMSGTLSATLESSAGPAIDLHPMEFDQEGDASTWLVSSSDLTSFDHITLRTSDGKIVATADIRQS